MSELFDKLTEYSKEDIYPFHMPGHKRNVGIFGDTDNSLDGFYKLDITEISGFDNLHNANGVIKEAQEKAARAYGSEHTYFLINGSTAGILSAVSAAALCANKDDKKSALIIMRDCHKSVYNAAFINGLELRYIYPDYDEDFEINRPVTADKVLAAIESAICEELNIVGILITSPTYEGVASDTGVISETAHKYKIPLIVDEAHGAHFGFNGGFPKSSVKSGADLVIHSLHKTLPAPTQTALIHLNGSLISREALEKYLRIYQSSSPSYPLMAGIDRAIDMLLNNADTGLENVKIFNTRVKSRFSDDTHVRICSYIEPGKILISVKDTCLKDGTPFTGKMLFCTLRDEYGLEMEMASKSYALGILTMADTESGVERLISALENINSRLIHSENKSNKANGKRYNIKPQIKIPFYKAFGMRGEMVSLDEAEGLTAADFINVYPPGTPIAVAGEIFTSDTIDAIEKYINSGFDVQGVEDMRVAVIKV